MTEVTLPKSGTVVDKETFKEEYPGWTGKDLDEYFAAAAHVRPDAPANEQVAYIYAAARSMGLSPHNAEDVCMELGHFEGERGDPAIWAKVADDARALERDPWNWLAEHVDDPDTVQRLRIAMRAFPTTDDAPTDEPTNRDVEDGDPKEPDWILRGQIAHGRLTMASGDQSSSKTTWALAVARAVIRGDEKVLGRDVSAGRVLYVTGEEDWDQIKEEKLKPLGFTNTDMKAMSVFAEGDFPMLGTDAGNAWLLAKAEAGDFDLIVVDTTSSVISVNANDNDAVNEVIRTALKPACRRTGAGLVYLHHERKSGGSGDRSQAARGARAWSDRAIYHVSFAAVNKYDEKPTGEGEHVATAKKFVQRRPKAKGGGVDEPVYYELRGEKDKPDGATLNIALELPRDAFTDAELIAAACDGETKRKALADALGWHDTGSRFTNALEAAEDQKLIRKVERGVYAPGEATE